MARPRTIPQVGQQINLVKVLEFLGKLHENTKATYWKVECLLCGEVFPTKEVRLNPNNADCITSCGCHTRYTHNLVTSRLNKVWRDMKQRCINPSNSAYKDYGGRGIAVCDGWASSFKNYYDYITSLPGYFEWNSGGRAPYHIDRINNDGNYEPGNVRISTYTQNARNKRNTRKYNVNGINMCLGDIVDRYDRQNLGIKLVADRLRKGYSLEEAVFIPKATKRGKVNEFN